MNSDTWKDNYHMNQFLELIIFGGEKKEVKSNYQSSSSIISLTKIIDDKCPCNVYFKIVTFYYYHIRYTTMKYRSIQLRPA